VDIQSKEVIDKISDELKVQPAMSIPRELAKNIQLVYGVNPVRLIQVTSKTTSDATTSTILTTNATKRTFVVAMNMTIAKDVVSTSLVSAIRGTPLGDSATDILRIRTEPVTVGQNLNNRVEIPMPGLELEKGTTLTLTNSTAIASIDTTCNVYFYETDPQ